MAEPQLPKLMAGVRFPSPALSFAPPVAHSPGIPLPPLLPTLTPQLPTPFLKLSFANFAAAEVETTSQLDRMS